MSATDRDALADALIEWWVTFDGPAYPSGREVAAAILDSDWLARVREQAAREALLSAADDAYALFMAGKTLGIPTDVWLRDRAADLWNEGDRG